MSKNRASRRKRKNVKRVNRSVKKNHRVAQKPTRNIINFLLGFFVSGILEPIFKDFNDQVAKEVIRLVVEIIHFL